LSSLLLSFFIYHQLSNVEDSIIFYKGNDAYLKGDYATAEEILTRHNNLFPDSRYSPDVLFLLGEINFRKDEYNKAIDYWLRLNQNYPESDYALEGLIRIGDVYSRLKRYDSAIRIYKQVKKNRLANELLQELDLKINENLYYLGKYPGLVEALQDFINTHTDTTKSGGIVAETMLRLARIYITKKEYYSAQVILQRIIDTYPQSPVICEVFFEQANVYKLMGDNQRYKKMLQAIILNKDTLNFYPYAIIELANIYRDEQRYDSSLHYWVKLKDIENYQDMALREIARTYYRMGFIDEAVIVLQTLIKDFPESKFLVDAYLLWAEILKKDGDLLNAKEILSDLLKKRPRQPDVLLEFGAIYFGLKDYAEALNCYLQASEAFKDQRDESAKALIKAGDAALAMNDTTNAKRYYLNAGLIAVSEEVKNLSIVRINQMR